MMNVNGSTSCWPGTTHSEAISNLLAGAHEPVWGKLGTEHIQICPQNRGVLDEDGVAAILALLPNTSKARLHANVRLFNSEYGFNGKQNMHDASTGMLWRGYPGTAKHYFHQLAKLSNLLGSPAYTLHAGSRRNASLDEMRKNVLAIEQLMQIPVGVEGLYPQKDMWLIHDWSEYAWLLESGLNYAIDMSHLHIVATQSDRFELNLLKELVSSSKCIEVHVSGNNGDKDSHELTQANQWWFEAMLHINQDCVIFTEGDHR